MTKLLSSILVPLRQGVSVGPLPDPCRRIGVDTDSILGGFGAYGRSVSRQPGALGLDLGGFGDYRLSVGRALERGARPSSDEPLNKSSQTDAGYGYQGDKDQR